MKEKNETSAGGIVYKKSGAATLWLITQHSQHKGWVFPKGLIGDTDESETRETAAMREVEEEGGVKTRIIIPEPIETSYTYDWHETLVHKKVYYYLMEYVSGDPKNHDWEMMDARFATIEEVRSLLKYQADKDAFEKALTLLQSL
jgi:8-oxo-dGTP pyrophosphatase MutT (NUDIX family)